MYKTEFTNQMEKEFGNFNEIPIHFRPKLNENPSNEEMFNYIKNHLRYYTMNSWNRSTLFANNVKIHNLNFNDKQQNLFHEIYSSTFDELEQMLFNDNIFEILYLFSTYYDNQYKLNFNGRSGGYLVIYKSAKNLLGGQLTTFPGKSIGENFIDYSTVENYIDDNSEYSLKSYFQLLYDFDTICDILRFNVGLMLNQEIEEYEEPQPIIKKKRFKEN